MSKLRLFHTFGLLCGLVGLMGAAPASAIPIGGVEFPQGAASFADAVVSYTLGPGGVTTPHQNPLQALGTPDYNNDPSCASQADCTFVSLGGGGVLVLQFTNNVLTGSGDGGLDLWIFEVGPAVEDTTVDISMDGLVWIAIGQVSGATSGIDIDPFVNLGDEFAFVRLTDVPPGGGSTGGADIDAVGAISTRVIPTVPEPSTIGLMGLGLMLLVRTRLRKA